jgi:hemolysin D
MAARILQFSPRPGQHRRPAERAFLPAALEIVETPASPTLRVTAFLICLFLASAVAWSYFGHVDIIATAPGKVIARSHTKIVQPHDTGVVRAIHVADGDEVEAGEVLIELDPTDPTADRARFANMLVQARLDRARLRALLDPTQGDAFAGLTAHTDLIAAARARLEAEEREQAAKLAKLDHQVAQKRAEQAQIEAQIAKIDEALPLVRERAAIRAAGLKSGYGNKLDLLTQTQQVVEQEHERVSLQRKHDEIDAALAELDAVRKQAEAEFRRNALTDVAKADREATEAAGELAKAEERTKLQTLTAPVAGTVQDLTVHTLGGIVTPAQQLLRIVPSDGGIEVEAVIANQDVGFVEIGQQAEIKIETFPFTRYGLMSGHVGVIARDSVD